MTSAMTHSNARHGASIAFANFAFARFSYLGRMCVCISYNVRVLVREEAKGKGVLKGLVLISSV